MKVLFVSHTANFSKFNRPFMRWFRDNGWQVHYASAGEESVKDCDAQFTVPLARSPLSFSNFQAYRQLKKIIDEGNYSIIHAHTPTGGVVARLAARKARQQGTRVIYTAHGFHFYTGAPLFNWLLYYPIEKLMSYLTDDLITINSEDYALAKDTFRAKRIHKINGVGVDTTRFQPVDAAQKNALREKHGFGSKESLLICVAELNKNKNQQLLLKALSRPELAHAKLLLAGSGPMAESYQQLATKLGISNRVVLLGYRDDIHELYQLADIVVSASIREGLGLNLVEGMACGLPVVCSDNRGHRDIVTNERNGWLIETNDPQQFAERIAAILSSQVLQNSMREHNLADAEQFSLEHAVDAMARVYEPLSSDCK